jgi:hypothetical protein
MEMFIVVTQPGKICYREKSRQVITATVPVKVPNNLFYRRLIAEGSLLIHTGEEAALSPTDGPQLPDEPKPKKTNKTKGEKR